MERRNILAGLVLLALSAGYGYLIGTIPDRTLPNTPGPTFFPWIIAGAAAALSLALVLQGVAALAGSAKGLVGAQAAEDEVKPEADGPGKGFLLAVAALVWFALYLAALPFAGFIVASFIFFGGLMLLYGARNPLLIAVASCAIPAALYLLFRHVFTILLPTGIW